MNFQISCSQLVAASAVLTLHLEIIRFFLAKAALLAAAVADSPQTIRPLEMKVSGIRQLIRKKYFLTKRSIFIYKISYKAS